MASGDGSTRAFPSRHRRGRARRGRTLRTRCACLRRSIDGRSVVISGEKKSETEKKDKTWRVVERSYGAFKRAAPLNFTSDPAKTKATADKEILYVTVGKPPEMVAKKVEIAISKAK